MAADAPVDIFGPVLKPTEPSLAPELAQYILTLRFSDEQHARKAVLAEKANEGVLDDEERAEYEWFIMAADFLALMQVKARLSLRQHPSAA
jgi:hypothetical protein